MCDEPAKDPAFSDGVTRNSPSRQKDLPASALAREGEFAVCQEIVGCILALRVLISAKLSLPFAPGNLCVAGALNLLLKIPSVRSRVIGNAADTVSDP